MLTASLLTATCYNKASLLKIVQPDTMKLAIKNMVCKRCILVISQELKKLNLQALNITLGEVELATEPTQEQLDQFRNNISLLGFELLDDTKKLVIEKIKNTIINEIHYADKVSRYNFSQILSEKLNRDYSYLSSLFSEAEGITIEKYIINQKIEKVKELLMYDELSSSKIAEKLGYSSIGHLSAQFKKITGLTPSDFKTVGQGKRKPLDEV